MASKKFSDLTAATTVAATDLFAIETAAGNSRKITRDEMRASLFSGALVHKSADQTAANYSAGAVVGWNSEASGYDTDGYHDTATNNSRITIPVTGKYRFNYNVCIGASTLTASDYARAGLIKNGSVALFVGGQFVITEISNTGPEINLPGGSAVVACTAGDYFEVWLDTESDTSITVTSLGSWFAVERVA